MNRKSMSVLRAATLVIPTLALAGTSHAWLGSFESADGYQPFLNLAQNYNAGQYGPNGGYGGGPVAIAPNTGLWQALQGGFSSGGSISYATGHQNFDRQWVNNGIGNAANQGMVFTTGHEGWGGPALKYKYDMDAPDYGGTAPTSSSITEVKLSFWVMGQLAGPEIGGQVPNGYFGNEVALQDSGGNVGARFGLTQRPGGDKVTYWDGTTLLESAITGASNRYDRWDVTVDLVNDRFSADYFQFSTSTLFPLVNNQPLQTSLSNLSSLTFRSSDGTQNNKLWSVDDFTFQVTVPGPASLALLAPAALVMGRRRR